MYVKIDIGRGHTPRDLKVLWMFCHRQECEGARRTTGFRGRSGADESGRSPAAGGFSFVDVYGQRGGVDRVSESSTLLSPPVSVMTNRETVFKFSFCWCRVRFTRKPKPHENAALTITATSGVSFQNFRGVCDLVSRPFLTQTLLFINYDYFL